MRRRFLALFLGLCVWLPVSVPAQTRPAAQQTKQGPPQPPKLVLAIVVDQFRYDYLTRFRTELTGGLKRLLDQGAVFTNANYDAAPTVTAVGHSTFLSGATPAISGIVGNTWWARTEAKPVTSGSDDNTRRLGGNGPGVWNSFPSTGPGGQAFGADAAGPAGNGLPYNVVATQVGH